MTSFGSQHDPKLHLRLHWRRRPADRARGFPATAMPGGQMDHSRTDFNQLEQSLDAAA